MATTRKCIVCHQRPAEVPDRNRMGRPIKRVCRQCHMERLRGDIMAACMIPEHILNAQPKRRTATELRDIEENLRKTPPSP